MNYFEETMDYPHEMDPSLSEDFLYYFDNPPIHTEQPRPSHQSMSSQKQSVASTSSHPAAALSKRQAKRAKIAKGFPTHEKGIPKKIVPVPKQKANPPKTKQPRRATVITPNKKQRKAMEAEAIRAQFACTVGSCQNAQCELGHPRLPRTGLAERDRIKSVQSSVWCVDGLGCDNSECVRSHPNSRGSFNGREVLPVQRKVKLQDRSEIIRREEEASRELEAEKQTQEADRQARMAEKQRLKERTKSQRKRDSRDRTEQARLNKQELEELRGIKRARLERETLEALNEARREEAAHTAMLESRRRAEEKDAEKLRQLTERLEAARREEAERERQERQRRVAGVLASIGKQLVSSHRHIWIDPSLAPVIWDDEEIGLQPIGPLLPCRPRIRLPALPVLPPLPPTAQQASFPPHVPHPPPRNLNAPYSPRNTDPSYPPRNPQPSYSSRNPNPPYPPRNPNPAYPPRHSAFPPNHPTHGNSSGMDRPHRGFNGESASNPLRPSYQNRYSATQTPPVPPPPQPLSEFQRLKQEMIRMEAELARLRSGVNH